jgi:hypothetical protein
MTTSESSQPNPHHGGPDADTFFSPATDFSLLALIYMVLPPLLPFLSLSHSLAFSTRWIIVYVCAATNRNGKQYETYGTKQIAVELDMDKYEEKAQPRRGHEGGSGDGVRAGRVGGWEGSTGFRTQVRSDETRRLDWVGIPVLGCVDEEVVG